METPDKDKDKAKLARRQDNQRGRLSIRNPVPKAGRGSTDRDGRMAFNRRRKTWHYQRACGRGQDGHEPWNLGTLESSKTQQMCGTCELYNYVSSQPGKAQRSACVSKGTLG